jgi:AcrR family transcriptional regulator
MARPRSDIQDRILAAARVRFLSEGVEAVSLRNIAKDADTSIGMVYYYYATKDDLFLAIVDEPYQAFLVDLEAILSSGRCFQERLSGFFGRIASMTSSELDILKLIAREFLTSNERRLQLKRRFLRGHLPLILRFVLEGVASGEIDDRLHPIVLLSCTLGLAGAATTLSQLSHLSSEGCQDANLAPEFVREALRDFPLNIPSGAEIADQLSRILSRAVGKRTA